MFYSCTEHSLWVIPGNVVSGAYTNKTPNDYTAADNII